MYFKYDIDTSKVNSRRLYVFYLSHLSDFQNELRRELSKLNTNRINKQLEQSTLFIPREPELTKSDFSRKIIEYIINHINVFQDHSGNCYYGISSFIQNKFSVGQTIDQLYRLIESGSEVVRPVRLFHNSFETVKPSIERLYKTLFERERRT